MPNRLSATLLALPRPAKRLVALTVDAVLCGLAVWMALCLRLDGWVVLSGNQWWAVALSVGFALPIFVASGLYRAIFRYAGSAALIAVVKAVVVYGSLYAATLTTLALPGVPRAVGFLQPALLLLLVGASRIMARGVLTGLYLSKIRHSSLPKVLIYGAGSAGNQLASAIRNSLEMRAVGFVDDDVRLHGRELNGLRIYAPAALAQCVERLDVNHVLLAIPSVSRHRRNEILELMRQAKVAVRTLPGLMEMAHGHLQASDLRELDIEDLLGRETVPPNDALLGKNIEGKVVLVTGAGGSIGSELCRQIILLRPDRLLLVESSEFALYAIHQELVQVLLAEGVSRQQLELRPLLADVQDEARLRDIMRTWRPHTIYHAAAYKHVPMVEHNPVEGVRNNVLGTLTAARVAAEFAVNDFVLISTDKAVRPTNIMGASKRLAEMVLQAMAAAQPTQGAATRFSMVRFGNVLGSSGSVVPLFRKQLKDGGPITLTHPDIIRYFMTIPEAAQLVIQAGAMAHGGDVFVLDMGAPIRIYDLAQRMIELSGLSVRNAQNPHGDVEIKIIGLRPGEKLYEELLIGNDPMRTGHPRIMAARDAFMPLPELLEALDVLKSTLDLHDAVHVRDLLKQLVPDYRPDSDNVDWVYLARQSQLEQQTRGLKLVSQPLYVDLPKPPLSEKSGPDEHEMAHDPAHDLVAIGLPHKTRARRLSARP